MILNNLTDSAMSILLADNTNVIIDPAGSANTSVVEEDIRELMDIYTPQQLMMQFTAEEQRLYSKLYNEYNSRVGAFASKSLNSIFYVDSVSGDNDTAVQGDPQKPYATIQAAINAAEAEDLVSVFPGSYTELVTLKDGVDLFCYDGVIFTAGGFQDASAVTCKILGRANFLSDSRPIDLGHNSDVELHFGIIDNNPSYARCISTAGTDNIRLKMFGDSITNAAVDGFGASYRGWVDLEINLKYDLLCNYSIIDIRTAAGLSGFKGGITVNARNLIIADAGVYGSPASYKSILRIYNPVDAGTNFVFNCGVASQQSAYVNAYLFSIPSSFGGNFFYNGSMDVVNQHCIAFNGTADSFAKITGVIKSDRTPLNLNGAGEVHVSNAEIRHYDVQVLPCATLAGTIKAFFRNCTLINETDDADIISHAVVGAELYLYDVLMTGVDAGATPLAVDSAAAASPINTINVRSNLDIDAGLVEQLGVSGFTQEANLELPKY